MKYLFVAVLLFVSSCSLNQRPSDAELVSLNYGNPPVGYDGKIKEELSLILIDPYSAHIIVGNPERAYWRKDGSVEGYWIVYAAVNAKNRMGGYTGSKIYGFLFKDGNIVKSMDDIGLMRAGLYKR